jgi:hypothetical protein
MARKMRFTGREEFARAEEANMELEREVARLREALTTYTEDGTNACTDR